MDRVARRGPLARAPGALKSHNAEKVKGERAIHSVAKQQKIEGGPFGLAQYGMLRGKTGKTR